VTAADSSARFMRELGRHRSTLLVRAEESRLLIQVRRPLDGNQLQRAIELRSHLAVAGPIEVYCIQRRPWPAGHASLRLS
jgi:hypothetical protein